VVSEDGIDTERSVQVLRGLREVRHRPLVFVGGVVGCAVVADENDEIRVQLVRDVDDLLQMLGLENRIAIVDIGDRGNRQG